MGSLLTQVQFLEPLGPLGPHIYVCKAAIIHPELGLRHGGLLSLTHGGCFLLLWVMSATLSSLSWFFWMAVLSSITSAAPKGLMLLGNLLRVSVTIQVLSSHPKCCPANTTPAPGLSKEQLVCYTGALSRKLSRSQAWGTWTWVSAYSKRGLWEQLTLCLFLLWALTVLTCKE